MTALRLRRGVAGCGGGGQLVGELGDIRPLGEGIGEGAAVDGGQLPQRAAVQAWDRLPGGVAAKRVKKAGEALLR